MNKFITIINVLLIIIIISCSKENNNVEQDNLPRIINDSIRNYSDSSGTWLTISKSIWFMTLKEKEDSSGYRGMLEVFLIISGSTNADSVTVRNIGYGLYHEEKVTLDAKKNFYNDTTSIIKSFLSSPLTFEHECEIETYIKAYKGTNILVILFKSGKIKC